MTSPQVPQFPGVSLFWEMSGHDMLTIAMRAPSAYARKFPMPGDMLYQFLMAVQSRGIDVEHTEQVRVTFNNHENTFLIRWSGRVLQNPELVHDVVPALSRELGIKALGDG